MDVLNLAGQESHRAVALETTLLVHGVPGEVAPGLASDLQADVRSAGAVPAVVGVVGGRAVFGLGSDEIAELIGDACVPKLNTANLGVALHRGWNGATTVSTTMEIAAAVGCRVFATGGIGGVHRGYAERLDISADLAALARFPVAVVASGVKGILDVASTREALESLGVPVIGFQTDVFPAFYVRESGEPVDARFDDAADLARYIAAELRRSGRGILVCQPAPKEAAMDAEEFGRAFEEASRQAPAGGRDATPRLLARLHEVTGGRTLEVNLALARANARLAGAIAAALPPDESEPSSR